MDDKNIVGRIHKIYAQSNWTDIAQLVRAMDKFITSSKHMKEFLSQGNYVYKKWGEYGAPAQEETFPEYRRRSHRMILPERILGKRIAHNLQTAVERMLPKLVPYHLLFEDQNNEGKIAIKGNIRENQILLNIYSYGTLEKPGSNFVEKIRSHLDVNDFAYSFYKAKHSISRKKFKL